MAEAHFNNHLSALDDPFHTNLSQNHTQHSPQHATQPNNDPPCLTQAHSKNQKNRQGPNHSTAEYKNPLNLSANDPLCQQPWQAASRIACYIDASTSPDLGLSNPRMAGLVIYIVDMQIQPTNSIYIMATTQEIYSVVAAEAAALALATVILHRLNYKDVFFYTNCANLLELLHSPLQDNLPDWRMYNNLKIIQDCTQDRRPHFYKIDRELNSVADTLAKLAFNSPAIQSGDFALACSFGQHIPQCHLVSALSTLPLAHTRVLAACCC